VKLSDLPLDLQRQALAKLHPTTTIHHRQNKTEALFASHLELLKKAGDIQWWAWEPMKFKLAEMATTYTPDFCVFHNDNSMEFVEVKGFLREKASVKFKVALTLYPMFTWTMIRFTKGNWEKIKGSREGTRVIK
jgi:hypothetical protein